MCTKKNNWCKTLQSSYHHFKTHFSPSGALWPFPFSAWTLQSLSTSCFWRTQGLIFRWSELPGPHLCFRDTGHLRRIEEKVPFSIIKQNFCTRGSRTPWSFLFRWQNLQLPPEPQQSLVTSASTTHKKELASDPWASHAPLKLPTLHLAILRGSVCLLLSLWIVAVCFVETFFSNAVVVHADSDVGIYIKSDKIQNISITR